MNPFAPKDFSELPPALWIPRHGTRVFSGNASDIVLDMASSVGTKPRTIKLALRQLVATLSSTSRIRINLPWEQPEAMLARTFLQALLQAGICQPVPRA